jgi:hypothetical protein
MERTVSIVIRDGMAKVRIASPAPTYIATCLQHTRLAAANLSTDDPARVTAKPVIVYNGTLGAGLGHRFDRIANAGRAFAKVA